MTWQDVLVEAAGVLYLKKRLPVPFRSKSQPVSGDASAPGGHLPAGRAIDEGIHS
jgi:hypothetical protein